MKLHIQEKKILMNIEKYKDSLNYNSAQTAYNVSQKIDYRGIMATAFTHCLFNLLRCDTDAPATVELPA